MELLQVFGVLLLMLAGLELVRVGWKLTLRTADICILGHGNCLRFFKIIQVKI